MNRLSISIFTFAAMLFVGCNSADTTTHTEAADPTPLTEQQLAAWSNTTSGLNALWGSADLVYSRSLVPQNLADSYTATAWRGERVSAQLVLWTTKELKSVECKISDFKSDAAILPSRIASTHFVRYVIGDKSDKSCLCGRPNGHQPILQADLLDDIQSLDIEACTTRPIWISIDVPQGAPAGVYTSTVEISHKGWGSVKLPLELNVVDHSLASSSDWQFHLDLWQHPSAVARVEGVELWSEEHFEAMRPIMQRLADAGQKVITATLNRDPWRYQCFDDYEPMIHWTLYDNDVWSYDYTIFDKWVEFMLSLGIDKQINCYSMLPWGDCILDYQDKRTSSTGRNRTVQAAPGTPEFEKMWGPFLVDFAAHLQQKGWLSMTNMAIDERAPKDMDEAARLIKKYAPQLGFAIADNHNSYKRYSNMRDVCVGQKQAAMSFEEIAARRAKGDVSTFYVCCSTLFPNVFTNSQPYEAELLAVYALAYDYDGMLRWAYNSWPANPLYDSRFRYWASGDTFLVYPGNRSSLRFERLRDGIELFEKVHTLRRVYADRTSALAPIEELLANVRTQSVNDPSYDWVALLAELNRAVNSLQ